MSLEIPEDKEDLVVDISVQAPQWNDLKGVNNDVAPIAHKAVKTALKNAILPQAATNRILEVSVVLANDDLVQVLNREYRNKDKPTNVLTFATLDSDEPIMDGPLNLGDIILSYETIRLEATEQGKFMLDHLQHLIVHGALHLLGYDHISDEEATDMETLEIRILERLGIQNPYIDDSAVL